ncbi:hypothetical protein CERSUDRAFT_86221 [Gelatoporia subvermispora B]|uniref:Uncharacterized protein n=1 Tax=Ceriporiopsis subvermispora (strain B) TaxID=914234 RepID=M2R7Y2_CERS8|nr:hypothetical protein CERSUDRAFT_86221 [Gelatoporia subvermispora B]
MQESHYGLMQDDTVSMIPYPGLAPPTPLTSANPSGAFGFQPYNTSPFNTSPDDISPIVGVSSGIPSPGYASSFAMQQARAQAMLQGVPSAHHAGAGIPMAMSPPPGQLPPSLSRAQLTSEEEIQFLQRRVRDLEIVNSNAHSRIRQLEYELAHGSPFDAPSGVGNAGSLPSPLPTPVPTSRSFEEDWRARTEARVKLYCSLNRAGNALCAWHDSRRERRAYPPRMAPKGHLNCGCTYEEALFEESLSRHGVGSYHPGENVRMDPALRNPLLKLLQQRYGYRDGDFERDPQTGEWIEGEGAAVWQDKLSTGASHVRRRGDERRST